MISRAGGRVISVCWILLSFFNKPDIVVEVSEYLESKALKYFDAEK